MPPLPLARLDRPRFVGRTSGHVESWFWRANDPDARRAIWLKATVLQTVEGDRLADAWAVVFTPGRATGLRRSVPLADATFAAPLAIDLAGCSFTTEALRGRLDDAEHALQWDLRFHPLPLGAPLCLFPTPRLLSGPLPANKTVTPCPAAVMSGELIVDGERWTVDGWPAMRGHNWGPRHAEHYAWGHALFLDEDGSDHTVVEAISARVRLAGRLTPWLSAMVVRRGNRRYRFDRILDLWRQRPEVGHLHWSLSMRGADGAATLTMRARPEEVACLGYRDPTGDLRCCLNSKLAEVELRVDPRDADGFSCHGAHCGALEFLRPELDPRWTVVQ